MGEETLKFKHLNIYQTSRNDMKKNILENLKKNGVYFEKGCLHWRDMREILYSKDRFDGKTKYVFVHGPKKTDINILYHKLPDLKSFTDLIRKTTDRNEDGLVKEVIYLELSYFLDKIQEDIETNLFITNINEIVNINNYNEDGFHMDFIFKDFPKSRRLNGKNFNILIEINNYLKYIQPELNDYDIDKKIEKLDEFIMINGPVETINQKLYHKVKKFIYDEYIFLKYILSSYISDMDIGELEPEIIDDFPIGVKIDQEKIKEVKDFYKEEIDFFIKVNKKYKINYIPLIDYSIKRSIKRIASSQYEAVLRIPDMDL
ncbi:hypothetical protein ACFL1H_05715 [Nanoarchaeota archaeon]